MKRLFSIDRVSVAVIALLWLLLAVAPDSSQPTAWAWFALPSVVLVMRAAIVGGIAVPDRSTIAVAAPVLALTVLTLASISWAKYAPSAALQEGALMCMYVVVAAWAWVGVRSSARLELLATWFAGSVVLLTFAQVAWMFGPHAEQLFDRGRLAWPFGYPNAGAYVSALAVIVLASRLKEDGRRSAIALGAFAGLVLGVSLLYQSRGGLIALLVGLAVAVACAERGRARATVAARSVFLTLAAVAGWQVLQGPYRVWQKRMLAGYGGDIADRVSGDAAARALVGAGLVGLIAAVGFVAAVSIVARAGRRTAIGAVVLAAFATIAIGVWAAPHIERCVVPSADAITLDPEAAARREQNRTRTRTGNRLFQDASRRCEMWRRAADTGVVDRPLNGVGFGNFGYDFVESRALRQVPAYAHSSFAEVTSGGGIPGLALLLVAGGAVIAGIRRFVRDHRSAGPLVGGVVAVAATSYVFDFTWHTPAVTLPALVLVVGAMRAALVVRTGGAEAATLRPRYGIAGAAVLVLVVVCVIVPIAISKSIGNAARYAIDPNTERVDPAAGARLAARAARWDPTDSQPLITLARARASAGDDAGVISASRDAIAREPRRWTTQAAAAKLLRDAGDSPGAKRAGRAARMLNRSLDG